VSGDSAPGSVAIRCKDALIELLFRRALPSCDRRPDVLPGRVARLCNAGGVDMISRKGCEDTSLGGVGTNGGIGSKGGWVAAKPLGLVISRPLCSLAIAGDRSSASSLIVGARTS